MNQILKTSQKNEAKLYNIRLVEAVRTHSVQQFNGPYISAAIVYPDEFKALHGLRFYVNMEFDAAETYKQIYKIVVSGSFIEAGRTEENTIIGPWEAVDNALELNMDLTPFIIKDASINYVILYALEGENLSSSDGWTMDTDTKLNSFLMEGWYETDEHR